MGESGYGLQVFGTKIPLDSRGFCDFVSVTVSVRDVAVCVSIMCVQVLISWSHQITVYRLQ